MSSAIDPFFLFEHPSNIAAMSTLLDSEKFQVVEVKSLIGPTNNTIAIIELLKEDFDEDDLPYIVKTGIRREIMYDRESIHTAFHRILDKDRSTKTLYINVPVGFNPTVVNVINALITHGIDLGENSIDVAHIKSTNIIHITTTDKSIRFYGDIMIAFNEH